MENRPHITWCENDKPLRWKFVPRRDMPQVDEADQTALIEWLAFKGIAVTDVTVAPDALVFRQHVDPVKVADMPADVYAKPIWISADNGVLDGNHRASAHEAKGDPCNAIRVDLPWEEAIAAMFTFAGTYDLAEKSARAIRN